MRICESTGVWGGSSRLAAGGKEGEDALLLVDPAATDGARLAGKMLIAQHADTQHRRRLVAVVVQYRNDLNGGLRLNREPGN